MAKIKKARKLKEKRIDRTDTSNRIVKTSAGRGHYHWEWNEFRFLVYLLSEAKDFREILNLFIDLHTTKEITEIIRRAIIASFIISDRRYDEIVKLTGASENTIANISHKLERKKGILSNKLQKLGDYEEFLIKISKKKQKDWFSKMIDKTLFGTD